MIESQRFAPEIGYDVGFYRRLKRILPDGHSVIVPVDDSLIFGPTAGLEKVGKTISKISKARPDAILAFPGVFKTHSQLLNDIAWIVNLTASTVHSSHTRKALVGSVEHALQLGAEAVAVHVNVTSSYEQEMLLNLGHTAEQCDKLRMPLIAIMYPRRQTSDGRDDNFERTKREDQTAYSKLVAHAARIGVDLGASIIKTYYTGSAESFARVVDACRPVPVVVAGGELRDAAELLRIAAEVLSVGGAGVSYGRNVFGRKEPALFIEALKAVVHEKCDPSEQADHIL